MSDFRRLVDEARRGLARSRVPPDEAAGHPDSLRWQIARYVLHREGARDRLSAHLQQLEASVESFDLRSDLPRTPFKRVLVSVFNRMFSAGGLARHLGSTQKRANMAVLDSLRLLQAEVEEQDRTLRVLIDLLREADARESQQGQARP